MNKTSFIGKLGEDLACVYLIEKGYKVIERNFRRNWGELDLIVKDPDGSLVFVEVKTMRSRRKVGIPTSLLEDSDSASGQYGNTATQTNSTGQVAELLPEENLTKSKLIKLKRTAYLYANENLSLVDDDRGWRIDLVAITIPENVSRETLKSNILRETLTNLLKYCDIKHFENL